MILGRPFPNWSQRTLEANWATLSTIIKQVSMVDCEVFMETFSETGDIGNATKIILEKRKVKKQAVLFKKNSP